MPLATNWKRMLSGRSGSLAWAGMNNFGNITEIVHTPENPWYQRV